MKNKFDIKKVVLIVAIFYVLFIGIVLTLLFTHKLPDIESRVLFTLLGFN
jgi:hypothetical protein